MLEVKGHVGRAAGPEACVLAAAISMFIFYQTWQLTRDIPCRSHVENGNLGKERAVYEEYRMFVDLRGRVARAVVPPASVTPIPRSTSIFLPKKPEDRSRTVP